MAAKIQVEPDDLTDLGNKVQLVWACDYAQGPLAGLCVVDDEVCWYDCVDEILEGARKKSLTRVYHVFRLTEEQRQAEVRRHVSFMEYCGKHFNFLKNRKLPTAVNQRPGRFAHRHTSVYPENNRQGVYDRNEVVGKFTDKIIKGKMYTTP